MPGVPGISNYQIIQSAPVTVPATTQGTGTATCPAQTKVISGGVIVTGGGVMSNVSSSYPQATLNQWNAGVNNNSADAISFNVLAICATVSP